MDSLKKQTSLTPTVSGLGIMISTLAYLALDGELRLGVRFGGTRMYIWVGCRIGGMRCRLAAIGMRMEGGMRELKRCRMIVGGRGLEWRI